MTSKPKRGGIPKAITDVCKLVEDGPMKLNRLTELADDSPDKLVDAAGKVGFPTAAELTMLIGAAERCAAAIQNMEVGEDEFDDTNPDSWGTVG